LAASFLLNGIVTLIKKLPLPLRRLIGDISDEERALVGLDILPRE